MKQHVFDDFFMKYIFVDILHFYNSKNFDFQTSETYVSNNDATTLERFFERFDHKYLWRRTLTHESH